MICRARLVGNARPKPKVKRRQSIDPTRLDPTRTIMLRRAFQAELTRRFNRLKKAITDLLVKEDAFGLTTNARFRFASTQEQVAAFLQWLAAQIQADIFLGAKGTDDAYWTEYIRQGYEKGAGRAFDDTRVQERLRAYSAEKLGWYAGTKEEFLRSSFAHPISVEKVKLLASRTFMDLKGATDAMVNGISHVLMDGLVQGQSPRTMASTVAKQLEMAKSRALTISRTEIIRAHAEGALDALSNLGVEQVGVMVEWSTSKMGTTALGNPSPCKLCAALEGVVMTIKEARGLFPRHPNCMCSPIPANVGEDTTDQIRGKRAVQVAIDKSISQEIPAKSDRSLETQKRMTSWAGAVKRIASQRPRAYV